MSSNNYPITIIEGADFLISLSVKKNGRPLNLVGKEIVAELRTSLATDSTLITQFNVQTPNPERGNVLVGLTPKQTINLLPVNEPKEQYTPAGVFHVALITELAETPLLIGDAIYQQTITRD